MLYSEVAVAHMYPAQRDEVVLILHQKELLLVLSVTVIWAPALLRHDHMRHCECVPCLKQKCKDPSLTASIQHYTAQLDSAFTYEFIQVCIISRTSLPQSIPHVSTARIVLLLAKRKNLLQSSAGTPTCLKPSTSVPALQRKEASLGNRVTTARTQRH